jgi:hypothetical protein
MTKANGEDLVENPWINLIACTTPAWIAGNFPEYVIGGGFTSRCLFVYTDTKEKYVAYPSLVVPKDLKAQQSRLVQDLEHISVALVGPYQISAEALEWGDAWYKHHYTHRSALLDDDRFGGYIARKQTHIHKLAMIVAASQRDDLIILPEDLATANTMVTDLEADMPKVFAKIGRSEESVQAERFVSYVRSKGAVGYNDAYAYLHLAFPHVKDMESIVHGALRANLIEMSVEGNQPMFKAVMPKAPEDVRT